MWPSWWWPWGILGLFVINFLRIYRPWRWLRR